MRACAHTHTHMLAIITYELLACARGSPKNSLTCFMHVVLFGKCVLVLCVVRHAVCREWGGEENGEGGIETTTRFILMRDYISDYGPRNFKTSCRVVKRLAGVGWAQDMCLLHWRGGEAARTLSMFTRPSLCSVIIIIYGSDHYGNALLCARTRALPEQY